MGHDEDRVKPTTAAERNKKSNHHMQYIDNPAIRLLASALIIWRGDQEVAPMGLRLHSLLVLSREAISAPIQVLGDRQVVQF
jgi:hypothetical protein